MSGIVLRPRRFARTSSPCQSTRRSPLHHPGAVSPVAREVQLGPRQPHQLLHRAGPRQPRQRQSAICSTASAMACRSCRPPTPASPHCRNWSIPRSRSTSQVLQTPVGYSTKSNVTFWCRDHRGDGDQSAGPREAMLTVNRLRHIADATSTTTKLSALTTAITTATASRSTAIRSLSTATGDCNSVSLGRRIARSEHGDGGRLAWGH